MIKYNISLAKIKEAVDKVDEEVDTIGGLIMQTFGYLPKRGEEITLENLQFKVTSADSRRLIQLRVTVPDEHLAEMDDVEEKAE